MSEHHATIRWYTRRPERTPPAGLPTSGVFRYTCLPLLPVRVVADVEDVEVRTMRSDRQDPRASGQEACPARPVRNAHSARTEASPADGRLLRALDRPRGAAAATEFLVKTGALPLVASRRLLLFVRGDHAR